jgi:flavin reductase (DIM6/NTAB) family NADH-FMN oxidoreductase RutF
VTIHGEHPFIPPESERDPVRRLRGRLGGAVSLWTTGEGADRVGLTVSSLLLAPGDPAHVLGLIDPDSALAEAMDENRVVVVQLLKWPHRQLSDAFAGRFPAPGGPFRLGEDYGGWVDTDWGPLLTSATSWLGARLVGSGASDVGWGRLYDAAIEHIQLGDDEEPLEHRRGRYQRG